MSLIYLLFESPYLLACRLNHQQAADLLLEIGHASPMQADQSSFFDAERWKQEGQIERLKSYLKTKQEEMNYAKLCGNVKLYKELNSLSRQLDEEMIRNSDILPVLAKIIIDNESQATTHASPTISRLFNRSCRTFREFNTSSNIFITACGQSQASSMSLNDSVIYYGVGNGAGVSNLKSKSTFDFNPSLNTIIKQTMNNLSQRRIANESPIVRKKIL